MNDWESPLVTVSGPAVDPTVDGLAQLAGGITAAGILGYLDPHLG